MMTAFADNWIDLVPRLSVILGYGPVWDPIGVLLRDGCNPCLAGLIEEFNGLHAVVRKVPKPAVSPPFTLIDCFRAALGW